jgi:NADH:ubiquinone oxidoreductase subunit 5 (subunit L)/multisubunit Na+/H+ antiporter MnhA subunit/multisubunit Na+/H+ antiporter MnhB subunit
MTGAGALPWIVFLPFAAAGLALLFGRVLGRWCALLMIGAAALCFAWIAPLALAAEPALYVREWIPGFGVAFRLRADGFGGFFAILISGIGTLIGLYSLGYVAELPNARLARYYAALLAFMGAMLGVALADDLVLLFVFWEITSLTSFLLIGFWYEREPARHGAVTALLVTALGGLALMAGIVLIAQATGSFALSEIVASADARAALATSPLFVPALLLVLLGAFTKSAQFPFHFWLPGAMVAPTPVSAYLHAATMVKAGVFLLGRVGPLFAASELWPALLVPIGLATFLLGAWQSFREHDLKALLAYSTVSTLGLLTLIYGLRAPDQDALQILSHAGYKGGLFLIAGIIEHHAGTRDLRELGGLRRALPLTFALCLLGVLSMGGVPPLMGFVAKEALYTELLHNPTPGDEPALRALLLVAVIAGNALLLGSGLRMLIGAVLGAEREPDAHGPHGHGEPALLWLPPALLAVGSLGLGLAASSTEHTLNVLSSNPAAALHVSLVPTQVAPFALSLLTLALGAWLYAQRARVHEIQARLAAPLPDFQDLWDGLLDRVTRFAEAYSSRWQSGSLRWYFSAILLSTAAIGFFALAEESLALASVRVGFENLTWTGLVLAALLIFSTLGVVRSDTRLGAALALTATGFLVALLYAVYRSPDILLTQILIETVSTIVILLVLYFMPRFRADGLSPAQNAWNATVSGVFGFAMFLFVLLCTSPGLRETRTIAADYLARSLPEAGGRTAVNVIIVDFRALDTLGEITVLVVVGLCVFGLLRARRGEA